MAAGTPRPEILNAMAAACEGRYAALLSGGCDPDVAADRTFDALRAALGEIPHSYDGRDRLFKNKLRAIAAEGI